MTAWIKLGLVFALSGGLLSAASLRATGESQIIQNQRADGDHLSRMENDTMAARWKRLKLLTPVASKTSTYYLSNIPKSSRYLRPWSKLFLSRLSRQYRTRFGKPLRVTSLLRTAVRQKALRRRNGNAASVTGPKRSSHLTGASIDISKKDMGRAQRAWMRRVLLSLHEKGYLYAIEENQQPNFHVMVYRSYEDYVAKQVKRKR